jgi:hypothetical protein
MSAVEASITINLPDGVDPENFIRMIQETISRATGNETEIHVTETDDPLTTNPIGPR